MSKHRMSGFVHLVQFQRAVTSEDDPDNTRGDVPLEYVDDFQAYVSIDPLTGREALFARQMEGTLTHKIGMQTDRRVTHRHRFIWSGRVFNCGPIITPGEREQFTEFYAGEILG